ncbi:NAD(P)-dependent oxidoreductase [Dysgonomonas sp. HGC4]|uniref:NAD(P)-dependent oxidoreductase n=1 Tax=Dysgonomonas sp. HGC4 TaxID=1658009 RepID=UPI0006825A33|nr:NAD(P)-dependent oxidoreductase [Dysgonomonas sp. HGC4]MBD8349480.1 dihydrofolate reductase [Dysgonomonas sp. HGC4]
MKFQKITMIDACRLTENAIPEIQKLSTEPLQLYWSYPSSEEEVIERIGDSDCILVSFQTRLTPAIIAAVPNLKYIGMCCSLFSEETSSVDIPASRERGIVVKGVKDYGDEGVVEFIFSQLINLGKGYGKYQWREEPSELGGKSIGIIGMGTLGKMVAAAARSFGMKVYYYSKTRKADEEARGSEFLPLKDLMAASDVVTLHLPRYTVLVNEEEFACRKKNSVFINTSFGPLFDKDAFVKFMNADKTSFAFFDADGAGVYYKEFSEMENIVLYDKSAGFTRESKERLSQKAIENMVSFLKDGK